MKIIFTKTGNEEQVLSCKRKDGSITWMHISSFFITHDLCHYAVETVMPLRNAFYGMVNNGTDITEFDLPKDKRNIVLAEEALFAEQLVNLLTIEYAQGRMDNFIEIFNGIYERDNEWSCLITNEKLEEIRSVYNRLMQQWNSLSESETM